MAQSHYPKLSDIASAIEAQAPLALQESYDNAGLQLGNPDVAVRAALLCLDVTEEVVSEAIEKGCNLIISHHPLIFHGVKHITGSTPTERIIINAIKHDIAIYSAHTNLDNAPQGVSHEIAERIGMTDRQVLSPANAEATVGSGLIGNINPMPLEALLQLVKEQFAVGAVRYSGEAPDVVSRVALCGGAGAFLIPEAIAGGAQVYITGDVKYHDFTGYGDKIVIADIGHFESEQYTKTIFYRIISEKFPNFALYFSQNEKNPIKYL